MASMANRFAVATLFFVALAGAFSFVANAQSASKLKPEYEKWLNEDVRWIITAQERNHFLALTSDQARDKFVVGFWERRNPTPEGTTNAFKEEHYRRLAFANEHFAANRPGWRTDRGQFYIVHGPPDSLEVHGPTERASALKSNSDHPYQIWHYKHIKDVGDDQNIRFVDVCSCGDYKMVMQ